ncbi:hypothetical protein V6B05_01815 [Lactococcus garvieae]|uniref:hypothetical protein n=1 Tax=Lactococcus garvieae TaxID=1363 RepID=UPI001F604C44|nr:hypothetical protein [Lactococcus garvieae]MCI3860162.1 hypothetical protein [Lactococcus garvieae]
MELKCTDCMVTFEAPYDKDCPFCGTDAFVVEITNNTEKIEKKLATAVEALKRITEIPEQEEYFDCEECISMMEEAAKQALAEIGGEDE